MSMLTTKGNWVKGTPRYWEARPPPRKNHYIGGLRCAFFFFWCFCFAGALSSIFLFFSPVVFCLSR